MNKARAAIVVGRNLNALGIVRSLAAGGVEVVLLCPSRLAIAALSRHCRVIVVRGFGGRDIVEALKAARRQFDEDPALFLTEEDSVAAVAAAREELEGLYRFGAPSPEATDMLSDKALFHEFATREGIPAPRGAIIRRSDEIVRLADFDLPVVIKPADKGRVAEGPGRSVILATTWAEAAGRCDELIASGAGALVQEWIEGADGAIHFCLFHADDDGNPLVMFTGRKVASFPPRVGSTAICVPAPEAHAELAALTTKIARRAGMAGLGSVEYKWDSRGRRFVVIEPTVGRSDWQEEIATLAGVNIPLAAWAWLGGDTPVTQATRPARVAWRSSFRHRAPVSELLPGARVYDGYWRRDDPLPALAYYLVDPLRRLWRRARARARGASWFPAPVAEKSTV